MRPARLISGLAALALVAGLAAASLLAVPGVARAEYRAYELEIVDLYDCRVNKREVCRTGRTTTALDPRQYLITHGGPYHIGVLLLATWMCYGDTSFYKVVCPRPQPKKPKFAVGDEVQIHLDKHITDGWKGVVEVAYYQESVRSNVYGVRFPERRQVYARYYEKDLRKAGAEGAGQGQPAGGGQPAAGQPAGAAPATASAQATLPQATPPP